MHKTHTFREKRENGEGHRLLALSGTEKKVTSQVIGTIEK